MKRYVFSVLIFFVAHAQAQLAVTGLSPKIFDAKIGECHLKITDPFNGRLRVDLDEKPKSANYHGPLYQKGPRDNDLWMQLRCKAASKVDKKLCGLELENGEIITSGLDGFSEEERRQIKKDLNQTLFVLNGKNWKGTGIQEDQISGDEELRTRSFNFCMPFGSQIVTGRVESAAQLNNLKESAMPNIIKLLEGIEFVDDAAVTDGATTNTH